MILALDAAGGTALPVAYDRFERLLRAMHCLSKLILRGKVIELSFRTNCIELPALQSLTIDLHLIS
jgi:hypothetical protein